VTAASEKPPYLGFVSQHGAEDDVVIQHEPPHLVPTVPVRDGFEAVLDF